MKFPSRKRVLLTAGFLLLPFLLEFLYVAYVGHHSKTVPPGIKLVLVYSGTTDRFSEGLDWAKKDEGVTLLCSGYDYSLAGMQKTTGLKASRFIVENRSKTTDQNVRYSKPLILQTGESQVVLALPWYHLPRALFVTKLYMMGTGVKVIPYASVPAPRDWWKKKIFYVEFFKFWGSLTRVALAVFGIENWPKPSSQIGNP